MRGLRFDSSFNRPMMIEFMKGLLATAKALGVNGRIASLEKLHNPKKKKSLEDIKRSANSWMWVMSWRGCQHPPSRLPRHYIVLQTEPLGVFAHTDRPRYRALTKFLEGATQVWEYDSFHNAQRYKCCERKPLPLGWSRAWTPLPSTIALSKAVPYKVFMFGKASPRRQKAIQAIGSTTPSTYFGRVMNPERDALAVKANVVLSIFASDRDLTCNMDAFRILPLLGLGAFVIAEANDHPFYKTMASHGLVTCSLEEMPAQCVKWTSPAFEEERRALAAHLQAVVRRDYAMARLMHVVISKRIFQKEIRREEPKMRKPKDEARKRKPKPRKSGQSPRRTVKRDNLMKKLQ